MKIIYRSISEEIIEAKEEAEVNNKTIKKIIVTEDEMRQLLEETSQYFMFGMQRIQTGQRSVLFNGITIEEEQ